MRQLSVSRKFIIVVCMSVLAFTAACITPTLQYAEAALVIETGSYTGGVTGYPGNNPGADIMVNKFNSALGTLTGATFTLTGNFAGTWHIKNNDGTNVAMYWGQEGDISISYGSMMNLSAAKSDPIPPTSYTSLKAWSDWASADRGDGNPNMTPSQMRQYLNKGADHLPNGVVSTGNAMSMNKSRTFDFSSPGDLAAFVGSGQLPFHLIANQFALALPGGGNYSNAGIDTAINGTVTAQYDYTPVPIPAAVWLLGSGLVGLIGISRRMQA